MAHNKLTFIVTCNLFSKHQVRMLQCFGWNLSYTCKWELFSLFFFSGITIIRHCSTSSMITMCKFTVHTRLTYLQLHLFQLWCMYDHKLWDCFAQQVYLSDKFKIDSSLPLDVCTRNVMPLTVIAIITEWCKSIFVTRAQHRMHLKLQLLFHCKWIVYCFLLLLYQLGSTKIHEVVAHLSDNQIARITEWFKTDIIKGQSLQLPVARTATRSPLVLLSSSLVRLAPWVC